MKRIHGRLGTAGFIIAIVALLAALSGGAYAASGGLSGKQKKEVTKIAQKEAKKYAGKQGAPGNAGATGATGSQGSKGETGSTGATGATGPEGLEGPTGPEGPKGAAGTSVTNIPIPDDGTNANCPTGGAQFQVGSGTPTFACNGEGGSGGSYPETLPSGHSESGFWQVTGEKGFVVANTYALSEISFPMALETEPTETVVIGSSPDQEEAEKCPGSVLAPAATAGVLCVYEAFGGPTLLLGLPQKFGAILYFEKTDEAYGSWAVKAG